VGNIDFESLSIIKKEAKDISKIVGIERAIKLEITEDSIIGNIDKLLVGNSSEIFIGDYLSSKKIFRFTRDGKFMNCYGRIGQGPGEYVQIMGFTIDAEDNIILLTPYKLIKFEKNGDYIKEVRTNYNGIDITSINDKIYIYISRYRHSPKIKKSILILDSDFREIGGLAAYDTRLEKYLFVTFNTLANNKKSLFFIDLYDLKLTQFNPGDNNLVQLIIPNENYKLKNIWGKKRLKEDDRTEIKKNLHRFGLIYSFKDNLFLIERCKDKKIFNFWILNLDKRKCVIFTHRWEDLLSGKIYFSRMLGAYDRGIIGSICSVEKFSEYKKEFDVLNDLEFSIDDNPILVFFELGKLWD